VFFRKRHQRNRPGTFDRNRQFTLVRHAIAGNPTGDDTTAFGEKIPNQTHILIVDQDLIMAKPAHTPALKRSSSFHLVLPTNPLNPPQSVRGGLLPLIRPAQTRETIYTVSSGS